jgi:hypothetical protein
MATPPREFAAAAMRMVGEGMGGGAAPMGPRRTHRNRRRYAPSVSPSPAPSPRVPPSLTSTPVHSAAPAPNRAPKPNAADADEPPPNTPGLVLGGRSLSFTRDSWQLLFAQEG